MSEFQGYHFEGGPGSPAPGTRGSVRFESIQSDVPPNNGIREDFRTKEKVGIVFLVSNQILQLL